MAKQWFTKRCRWETLLISEREDPIIYVSVHQELDCGNISEARMTSNGGYDDVVSAQDNRAMRHVMIATEAAAAAPLNVIKFNFDVTSWQPLMCVCPEFMSSSPPYPHSLIQLRPYHDGQKHKLLLLSSESEVCMRGHSQMTGRFAHKVGDFEDVTHHRHRNCKTGWGQRGVNWLLWR